MDKYIEVENYLVDVEALIRLQYSCDPALCRDLKCCCAVYDVWINSEDKERLAGYLPYASAWTGREIKDIYRCLRWAGAGYVLRKDSNELCMLACRSEDGRVLCSLHLAALSQNLPPRLFKPASCTLWPLSLSGAGGRIVSVQQDAYSFPCCRRLRPGVPGLHPGTASLARVCFGESFLLKLEKKLGRSD